MWLLPAFFGAINSKEGHQKLYNNRPKSATSTVQEKQTTDVSGTCETERRIRQSIINAQRGVELLCLMETHDLERYDMIKVGVWAGCSR